MYSNVLTVMMCGSDNDIIDLSIYLLIVTTSTIISSCGLRRICFSVNP
jgi:hypothetical protein